MFNVRLPNFSCLQLVNNSVEDIFITYIISQVYSYSWGAIDSLNTRLLYAPVGQIQGWFEVSFPLINRHPKGPGSRA
jgi:hypothetical protein